MDARSLGAGARIRCPNRPQRVMPAMALQANSPPRGEVFARGGGLCPAPIVLGTRPRRADENNCAGRAVVRADFTAIVDGVNCRRAGSSRCRTGLRKCPQPPSPPEPRHMIPALCCLGRGGRDSAFRRFNRRGFRQAERRTVPAFSFHAAIRPYAGVRPTGRQSVLWRYWRVPFRRYRGRVSSPSISEARSALPRLRWGRLALILWRRD